jgi:hypothetical protein
MSVKYPISDGIYVTQLELYNILTDVLSDKYAKLCEFVDYPLGVFQNKETSTPSLLLNAETMRDTDVRL